MNSLERSLEELRENLASTQPRRFHEAVNIVEDVRSAALRGSTEAEIAHTSSLLFHPSKGILAFLTDRAANESYDKAKVAALALLADYIQKAGQRLRAYALAIKNCCLKVFQDPRAAVKNASFEPLKALLMLGMEASSKEFDMDKLIETYWHELYRTAATPTVKANVLELLGTIAEHYPEEMMSVAGSGAVKSTRAQRLIEVYFTCLDKEMTKPKPDYPILVGSVRGLTACLTQFTKSVAEGEKSAAEKIYSYSKKFIQDVNANDYKLYIAALNLIARHASQFKEYLAADYDAMYARIRLWCQHGNRDLKNAAFAALESFLQQVASVIVSSNVALDKRAIFEYFVREFGGIFRAPDSDPRAVAIAIRGYGYFAPACRLFCSDAQIRTMFGDMLQRTEILYLRDAPQSEESLAHLPSFLNAVASILRQLGTLPEGLVSPVENLASYFISTFPAMPKGQRASGCKAVAHLLLALFEKGEVFRTVLGRLMFQGLVSTLSHPVVGDDAFEEGAVDTGAIADDNVHADYRVLWLSLLDEATLPSYLAEEVRQQLVVAIHDGFMRGILRILGRLDLSALPETNDAQLELPAQPVIDAVGKGKGPEAAGVGAGGGAGAAAAAAESSDPTANLQARMPKDFQVFISCVAFCRAILPQLPTATVHRWVQLFGQEIIVQSTRYPLVSGFYKLFGTCLMLCEKTKYFEGLGNGEEALARAARAVTAMEVDGDGDDEAYVPSDRAICFLLFRRFVREVIVRLHQYSDELLSACLQAVLAAPSQFLDDGIREYVPALQIAFRVGLGYLPLAAIALGAMERWASTLAREKIDAQLREVLPALNEYLKISDGPGDADESIAAVAPVSVPKAPARRRTVKKPSAVNVAAAGRGITDSDGTAIGDFRVRLVRFLGLLGGDTSAALVGDGVDKGEHMAWSSHGVVTFRVPYVDVKASIELDAILPRVISLAVSSSERQTKVAACELLHALTLYTLGLSQSGDAKSQEPFVVLFARIVPKLLVLACDVEIVARQLFRPLVMQVVRYLSQSKTFESPMTATMLNAVVDGLAQPDSTSLRDVSAACVTEFFAWTMKHTNQKELQAKTPPNIKSLVKRLYSMAAHPSTAQRLGAAAGFNAIYRSLREYEELVDAFALEMLYVILQSLKLADADDPELGTQRQASLAATNMVRTVVKHATLLCGTSRRRRTPVGWTQANIDLASFVVWLFGECGRRETEYRHACMELFFHFAPRCGQDASTAAQWVHRRGASSGIRGIVATFESAIARGEDAATLEAQVAWFASLQATLECYNWAFAGGFLADAGALRQPESMLVRRVSVFFKTQAFSSVAELESQGRTAREIDRFKRERCTVCVRAFELVKTLLDGPAADGAVVVEGLLSVDFFKALLAATVDPAELGFDVGDVKTMGSLPGVTAPLLISLASKTPQYARASLETAVRDVLSRGWARDLRSDAIDFAANPHGLMSAVSGYEQLLASKLLMPALWAEGISAGSLSAKLLSAVFAAGATTEMDPSQAQAAGRVLELALALDVDVDRFVGHLLNSLPTREAEQIAAVERGTMGDGRTKGAAFYGNFKQPILRFVARQCEDLVPKLVAHARVLKTESGTPPRMSTAMQAVLDLFEASRTDAEVGSRRRRIATACATAAASLEAWGMPTASAEEQAALLQLVRGCFEADADGAAPLVRNYLNLLSLEGAQLAFKAQLLSFLPRVLACSATGKADVERALRSLVTHQFPIRSTELPESGAAYRLYVTALDMILATLESAGWPGLLGVIVQATCREPNHRHSDAIRRSAARYVSRLSDPDVSAAVGYCHAMVVDAKQAPVVRRAVAELLAMPMLAAAQPSGLSQFVADRAKELYRVVSEPVPRRVSGASAEDIESDLISKWHVYRVYACVYDRLPMPMVNQQGSRINESFHGLGGKGNEMTLAITKAANAARTEPQAPKDECAGDLRRQYRCAAWNALAAVLVCTQDNPDLFGRLLFSENAAKGQLMWENLVDTERTYAFDVELVLPYDRKAKLAAIRQSGAAPVVGLRPQQGAGDKAARLRYLSSQYLADSSLSQDIPALGGFQRKVADEPAADKGPAISGGATGSGVGGYGSLSASLMEALNPAGDDEEGGVGVSAGAPGEPSSYVVSEDDLESDELNAHECMPWFLRVIDHVMGRLLQQPDGDTLLDRMPLWMAELHRRFDAPTGVHTNIRYLIAKVLTNRASVFRRYGHMWLDAAMRLVLTFDSSAAEPAAAPKEGLNYFVVDLLVTMLSWAPLVTPGASQKALASRLLRFAVERCYHPTRAVLRNDIEMVKTVIECWRDAVAIPLSLIYKHMSSKNAEDARNTTGIQLLAVVLVNGFKIKPDPAEDPDAASLTERRILETLAENVLFKRKEVYSAAAEVLGMVAAQKADAGDSAGRDEVVALLRVRLNKLVQTQETDRFIVCLHKAHLSHPEVVDEHLTTVFFLLPNLHGEFKAQALEMIHSRAGDVPDVFRRLRGLELLSMLRHRDESTQRLILAIILKVLKDLSDEEIDAFLDPMLQTFPSHDSAACRELMYDVLAWLFDHARAVPVGGDFDGESPRDHKVRSQLLLGLSDDSDVVRAKVRRFWNHETRLPVAILRRLPHVFSTLYSPESEQAYLGYASWLLLSPASHATDWDLPILSTALGSCTFREYSIDSSWQHRNAMTPLFAATQMSSQADQTYSGSMFEAGFVRATQDNLQFTPTLDANAAREMYGVPGARGTRSETFTQSLGPAGPRSSLLFRTTRLSQSQAVGQTQGSGAPAAAGAAGQATGKSNERITQREILLLRRRFVKGTATDSGAFHARRMARMKEAQEEMRRRQRAARAHTVTMLRSYKTGEIPDVMIKHRELILPLQALATRDAVISRQLFGALFVSLHGELVGRGDADDQRANTALQNGARWMIRHSRFYPPFVGCIEDISYMTPLTLPSADAAAASLASMALPTGMLVIEKGIAELKAANLASRKDGADERPLPKSKRARTEAGSASMARAVVGDAADASGGGAPADWLELSRLYRATGDTDTVLGVFRKELAESIAPKSQEALALEARGDYAAAAAEFAAALETDAGKASAAAANTPAEVERRLWTASRLECCQRLADWGMVRDAVRDALVDRKGSEEPQGLWDDAFLREVALPKYVQASVRRLVEAAVGTRDEEDGDPAEEEKEIVAFVDDALRDNGRKHVLLTRHSDDLAALSVLRGDLDRARYYASTSCAAFLSDWSSLHPRMTAARHCRLQCLQRTLEMDEFLRHVADPVASGSIESFRALLQRWSQRFPHPRLHPVSVWDEVVAMRELYVRSITETLRGGTGVGDGEDEEMVDPEEDVLAGIRGEIASQRIVSLLRVSEAARKQGNFAVAEHYYKRTFNAMREDKAHLSNLGELKLQWLHSAARRHRDRVRHVFGYGIEGAAKPAEAVSDAVESIAQVLASLQSEDANAARTGPASQRRHNRLKFEATVLLERIPGAADVFARSGGAAKKLATALGVTSVPVGDQLSTLLLRKGLGFVMAAVGVSDDAATGSSSGGGASELASAGKARLALASFADDVLRRQKGHAEIAREAGSPLSVVVVENTLTAMHMGLAAARDRFPRALELVGERRAECMGAFLAHAPKVPSWMFLQWLSQMVAVLDKAESEAVAGPLEAIAREYPQALYYPFRVSRGQLSFANNAEGNKAKAAVERIGALLASPTLDRFVQGLEEMTHLENVLTDWVRNDLPVLLENKDRAASKAAVAALFEQLFGIEDSAKSYRGSFAKDVRDKLKEACDALVAGKGDRAKFEDIVNEAHGRLKRESPGLLKEYSPWLASYKASDHEDDPIEIPGQYTGLCKPTPEHHVKIAGFDEKVLVLSSIRKPKRITVRGTDAREVKLLVKGGEDLRLDQRILQLFGVMNRVFANDAHCAQRGLKVRTYLVIPASARVGVLEWMSDTVTLREVLVGAFGSQKLVDVQAAYRDHFGGGSVDYDEMYKTKKPAELAALMERLHSAVPADGLRRALFAMAASPEAFVTLRERYVASVAATSICQYVVGVGDRHLSNMMVDRSTGGMVAIDFGHAFGSATQLLRVPELMPFRLTRQMRGVLTPLSVDASLRPAMVHCLRALEEHAETLLVPMSVFLKEPLLDWEVAARKLARAQGKRYAGSTGESQRPAAGSRARGGAASGGDGKEITMEQYATERLAVVRRKLERENPAYVCKYELTLGHSKGASYAKMCEAALGDASRVRARVGERCPSVEAQVDCLIDMATDPNVLLRAWMGWEAWM